MEWIRDFPDPLDYNNNEINTIVADEDDVIVNFIRGYRFLLWMSTRLIPVSTISHPQDGCPSDGLTRSGGGHLRQDQRRTHLKNTSNGPSPSGILVGPFIRGFIF